MLELRWKFPALPSDVDGAKHLRLMRNVRRALPRVSGVPTAFRLVLVVFRQPVCTSAAPICEAFTATDRGTSWNDLTLLAAGTNDGSRIAPIQPDRESLSDLQRTVPGFHLPNASSSWIVVAARTAEHAVHKVALSVCSQPPLLSPALLHSCARREAANPKLLLSFGSNGDGPGEFRGDTSCVGVSPDDRIWVGNRARVQVFSDEGKFLFAAAEGKWRTPCAIAFDATESAVFIADRVAGCVAVCKLDGRFADQLKPTGIAVQSKQGQVFVSEYDNSRISVFKRDGSLAQVINSQSCGFRVPFQPKGVCVTPSGALLVASAGDGPGSVFILDGRGKWLASNLGYMVLAPSCVCVDASGRLVVTDAGDPNSVFFKLGGIETEGMGRIATGSEGCRSGVDDQVLALCLDRHNRIIIAGKKQRVYVLSSAV